MTKSKISIAESIDGYQDFISQYHKKGTGKTTIEVTHALDVATHNHIEVGPTWEQYLLATTLAIGSFGFFKYQDYLESHTVRRPWNAAFVVETDQHRRDVQQILKNLINERGLSPTITDHGNCLDFRDSGGGFLKILTIRNSWYAIMGIQDLYIVVDHFVRETRSNPEQLENLRSRSQIPPSLRDLRN